ncbi:MAG: hypothetical protein K8R60_03820 [Burkholderiales bacterium]|nr:hypothetical protein [Burkholderiales bacterium]
MNASPHLRRIGALVFATFASTLAYGQAPAVEGPWRYGATLYVYLPTVGVKSSVPADPGGTPITFDVLEHLKFTLMGTVDAHNGRWGAFSDLVYVNLGSNKHQSRDFTIGDIGLPVGTTADLGWDLKGTAWTVGGLYRVVSSPGVSVDALGGVRWLDVRNTFTWDISGNIGPLAPVGQTGSKKTKTSLFDGIVGVRGRVALGDSGGPWSVPFYLDVGTGESKVTWQAAGGIRYSYSWGDLSAMWRYLDYDLKSGQTLQRVTFNGPMVGAAYRW